MDGEDISEKICKKKIVIIVVVVDGEDKKKIGQKWKKKLEIGIKMPWMVRTLIAMVVVVDSEDTKKEN